MKVITNIIIHKLLTACTPHACSTTICDIWWIWSVLMSYQPTKQSCHTITWSPTGPQ